MDEMMNTGKVIDLNENWMLHDAPIASDIWDVAKIAAMKEGWLPCKLPCDIHMPLIEAGIIKDPVLSDYCFSSEWIINRSWWFIREFDSSMLDMDADIIELCIESIDTYGQIFINGVYIGTNFNAHHPFVTDIKEHIIKGKNKLCVRITTGLEQVSDADLGELNSASTDDKKRVKGRGDERRAFVRRPQYTTGWDWGPKVPTCGIVKGANIKCLKNAVVRGVNVVTEEIKGTAVLNMTIEIESLDIFRTKDADLEILIKKDGKACAKYNYSDVLLTSGLNYFEECVKIKNPSLWWPSGYGSQDLYEIYISVQCEGARYEYPPFIYGIRTIKLDTTRTDGENRRFAIVVNDIPIFCKGGNWIPADSVYARVSAEKYDKLVYEARNANFNMLRIWGGGIYERDEFYNACDKYGILLWHDFMFGCSTYPDHKEWFRNEVDREMDYQTKRLRNHPSMGLWCGNNEDHWIFNNIDYPHWNISITHNKQYGMYTSNVQAKKAIRNNCPQIPFWNSSPYGGQAPNADNVGDVHHWSAIMMNPDINKRIDPKEYDKVKARFISEYGYVGPCPRESIEEYFDGKPVDRKSDVWDLHNNTFEKNTVVAGIQKHYQSDTENLGLDDYILYAGMVQSLMLGYSLEAIRFKEFCSGGIFWMYDDTWGEVGWTIVDYYLRRKVSFYGVKRALSHKKLIIREIDGNIMVMGCNDSDKGIETTAEIGYISLDGKTRNTSVVNIKLEARSRRIILDLPKPQEDYAAGVFAVIPDDASIDPAWLRVNDIKDMQISKPDLEILNSRKAGDDLYITLTSKTFAHGVHVKGNRICSDNYFDLLPGQKKTIRIEKVGGKIPEFYTVD